MIRFLLALLSLLGAQCLAFSAAQPLSPESQERANTLYREVRCPVCNGQSVAGSDVLIARTIRTYIDEQIIAGASDDTIKAALAKRYGDSILFEPSLRPATAPLWVLPWLGFALVGGAIWFITRKKAHDT